MTAVSSFIGKQARAILPPIVRSWIREDVRPPLLRAKTRVYEQAARVRPRSVRINLKLGSLLERQREFDAAISNYEQAIAKAPTCTEAHTRLAMLLRRQERYLEALRTCERAVEQNADSVVSYHNVAMIHSLLGNPSRAETLYHHMNKLKAAQARAEGRIGFILACTMPRSGSGFFIRSLSNGLGIPNGSNYMDVGQHWFPSRIVCPPPHATTTKPIPDGVAAKHIGADPENLAILNISFDRLVVQVREPRQNLMSWVQYLHYLRKTDNIDGILTGHLPPGYFSLPLSKQIDWHLNNWYYAEILKWIEDWLDAEADAAFLPKIMFSTHEDLALRPDKYWGSLLKFLDIDEARFRFPDSPTFKEGTHMRKGSPDEWREFFTKEQAEKAFEMIPERLRKRFGWVDT